MSQTAAQTFLAGPPPPYSAGAPPSAPPGAYGVPPPQRGPSPYYPQQSSGYLPKPSAYYYPQPTKDLPPPPAAAAPYSPAPSPAPAARQQRQTLHIYYRDRSSGQILGPDKSTPLYTWKMNCMSKPHLTMSASSSLSSTGGQIGTATFHTWSSKVDLVLHGREVTAECNGTFRTGHHMPSLAPGGQGSLKWKDHGSFSGKKDCTDGAGRTVAEFESSTWALSKAGKLHLFGDAAAPGQSVVRDEILLSVLVEIEADRRKNVATSTAVVASA